MKYLLPLALLLSGCFQATNPTSSPDGGAGPSDLFMLYDGRVSGDPPRDLDATVDAGPSTDVDAATSDSATPSEDAAVDAVSDAASVDASEPDATLDAGPDLGGQCAPCSTNTDCLDTHLCHPDDLVCYWHATSVGACYMFPGTMFSNYSGNSSSWHCKPTAGCP